MSALKRLLARLTAVARPGADREMDEEIRTHLELETEKNLLSGMTPEEARRAAMIAFGGVEWTREAHRDGRGDRWFRDAAADVRYALRSLRHHPVFTLAAVLTLALGIGANAAIFSAVNAVILKPLPFPQSEQLVMLWEENPEKDWHQQLVAPANYLDWKERVPSFEDAAAYNSPGNATLIGDGAPRVLRRARVTGNFFAVLGVAPELGRTLVDAETWDNGTHLAVLSHRAWQNNFAGDPGIIGRILRIDDEPVEVIGVMPQGFSYPAEDLDYWTSFEWKQEDRAQAWFRRAHWPRAIARVRTGVTLERANAELQQVAGQLKTEYPETNRVMGAGMTPLHEFLVGGSHQTLLVLLAAVALLLLIACANVGNLLLVRAAGRERETALRLALGAGRSRVIRQALTESIVLSLIGGVAGLLLGWAGARVLQSLQPQGLLHVSRFGLDWQVLAYVLGISMASGLLFGIAPALWTGRNAPSEALKEGGRTGSGGGRSRRWSEALVVGEIAVALLLTLGAGLLVRSFLRVQQVNPGFDPQGVISAAVNLPGGKYDTDEKAEAFFEALVTRARALPGVTAAATVTGLPLTDQGYTTDFVVAGRPAGEYGSEVRHRVISPDYFQVMRVPLLQGRGFSAEDRPTGTPVIIINEAFAQAYFQGQDPIGQRITFDRVPDSTSIWSTIVGVVGSERQRSIIQEPQIESFAPMAQNQQSYASLVVRTGSDPAALGPALRNIVSELDRDLAVMSIQTMDEIRSDSMARARFLTVLMLMFAGVGLVLSVIGVYGVMSQLTQRRTREMGIRMALGAQVGQVRWLVVGRGLRLVLIGLGLGLIGAVLTTRGLNSLLYQIPPRDPPTFIAVPLVIALAAIAACWIPAALVGRMEPASVLRTE